MEKTFLNSINNQHRLVEKAVRLKRSFDSKKGYYNTTIVKELIKCIQESTNSNYLKKVNKVSFRIAAIVVIEETIIKNNNDRTILKYETIVKQTKVQFKVNISNHHTSKFPNLENIHPKNPCLFYESTTNDEKLNHANRAKKGHYKKSLKKILAGKDWMLSLNKTEERLSDVLLEVKLC
jgi:Zn finger protein HypA/HybF involved in hydrogenase expression